MTQPATGALGASGAGSVAALEFEVVAASPATQVTVNRIAATGSGGELMAVAASQPHSLTVAP